MTEREKLAEMLMQEIYGDAIIGTGADIKRIREGFLGVADHLLANGVVVREKGEWERVIPTKSAAKWSNKVSCPMCHRCGHIRHNFCPNCGADMRKGENG